MKALLNKIASRLAMIKRLFGFVPASGEPPIAQQAADELMLTNVFLLLKEYPDFAVKTKDVQLLRRRLKRFERMQLRGGPEAAKALKQLEKQWKRVVRNKMMLINKETKNIHPVSGSPVSAHADEPGSRSSAGVSATQVAAVKTTV